MFLRQTAACIETFVPVPGFARDHQLQTARLVRPGNYQRADAQRTQALAHPGALLRPFGPRSGQRDQRAGFQTIVVLVAVMFPRYQPLYALEPSAYPSYVFFGLLHHACGAGKPMGMPVGCAAPRGVYGPG